MDHSSSVDPADEYDGPIPPDNVTPLPGRNEPLARFHILPDREPPRARRDYVAVMTAALDVLNARLLGLIATVAACVMWGFAVYDPSTLRSLAAIGFSVTVLAPIVLLYWRRGQP